jgi:hypothetical protein
MAAQRNAPPPESRPVAAASPKGIRGAMMPRLPNEMPSRGPVESNASGNARFDAMMADAKSRSPGGQIPSNAPLPPQLTGMPRIGGGPQMANRTQTDIQAGMKKGGKVPMEKWEHSAKDLVQDKKLAKKSGMSLEKWEKSAADKKHDTQQSMKGMKKGGMAKMARGGGVEAKGKTKGKLI